MDINFHYFAVKTIARYAGFCEEDAQCIAEYSQFVDDYNVWHNYTVKGSLPNYAKDIVRECRFSNSSEFYTVTTGFPWYDDSTRLKIKKYQDEIVMPFHFVPTKNVNEIDPNDRTQYRTCPATLDTPYIITELLKDAGKFSDRVYRHNLIQIGLLLHIFADTYAHDGFSGLQGWENFCYIEDAIYTKDIGKDEKDPKKYEDEMSYESYAKFPAIGHAEAGHVPDLTFVSFKKKCAANENQNNKDQYSDGVRMRTNKDVFLEASRQIFDFLRNITHHNRVSQVYTWDELKDVLERGFMIEEYKNVNVLCKEWKKICPVVKEYSYSTKKLWDDQINLSGTKSEAKNDDDSRKNERETADCVSLSDDFIYFNVAAKEIRDAIIQKRIDFSCASPGENSCADIESPLEDHEIFNDKIYINGERNLSNIIKFKSNGCVESIEITKTAVPKYDYVINVIGRGPKGELSSLYLNTGYLKFTFSSEKTETLSLLVHARVEHCVRFNKENGVLTKIEWSNKPF